MIFKVSLFLASLSVANAGMRGEATIENKNRAARKLMGSMSSNGSSGGSSRAGDFPLTTAIRSYDGSENPLAQVDAELQRMSAAAHYPDGQGIGLSMETSPNVRTCSNAVASQPEGIEKATVSDIFWQWGQFMDHDVGLTEGGSESAPIITEGCQLGDEPGINLAVTDDPICAISFSRAISHFTLPDGSVVPDTNGIPDSDACNGLCVREQLNEISGFLDANTVYGSCEARANFLREFDGGRLRMQEGGRLLPLGNSASVEAAGGLPGCVGPINADNNQAEIQNDLMIGGDIRVNEQTGLLAMHTLWAREHNRIAGILTDVYGENDENTFQLARKLVIAEIVHITYNEFLPLMIGSNAPDPTTYSFDSTVNPGVAQEFSAVAFRVGHTFLSGDLLMHNGEEATGSLNLVNAFFNPGLVTSYPGLIDEILLGQINQAANSADIFVIDEVRTNLFGAILADGAGGNGLDLVSLNVQRARDHGINKYNVVRDGYGLTKKNSFEEVSSDPEVVRRLKAAYGDLPDSVDLCDAWLCGLAEDPVDGGLLGEMFATIIGDQFERYMNGDEFFYQGDPDVSNPELIGDTGIDVFTVKLSDIINFNTIAKNNPVREFVMEAP